jgi:hypothetical protein
LHEGARTFIAEQAARLGPFESVLEIGSRNVNGSVREFFAASRYLGVDRIEGDGVDVVKDATGGWSPLEQPDCIVCCEVFEHTADWPGIVANIGLWLAPHGVVLLTMAGPGREPHSAVDGGALRAGEHYENIEPDELAGVLHAHGLDADLDLRNAGDVYAVARFAS